MKRMQLTLIAACTLAFASATWAESSADSSYLKRTTPRFQSFAGSSDNLSSLAGGLRSGKPITLTGSGEKVTFTSPTRPMGYGNITRSLDLAQRQLAAQGITNPTPSQLQAAMTGGTITGPKGTMTYAGVLQLRSQGMGWGQVAHSIGVHPGMGKSTAAAVPSRSSITSAAGGRAATSGKPDSPGAAGREQARISSAAGGNASMHGSGRSFGNSPAMNSAMGGGGAGAGGGGGHGGGRGK